MKTDCRPKRLRKYHESDETHRTSRSRVSMEYFSIDLFGSVSGKGSFTMAQHRQPLFHTLPFPTPLLRGCVSFAYTH